MKFKNEDFKKLMEAYESKVYYTKDEEDASGNTETLDNPETQQEPEITADDVVDSVEQYLIKLNQEKERKAEAELDREYIEFDAEFSDVDISNILSELEQGIEPGSRDTFNHKGLYLTIGECYDVGRPLLVYGDTGIGKSTAFVHFARDKAKELGRIFVDYSDIEEESLNKLIKEILDNPEKANKYFLFLDVRAVTLSPDDLVGIPDMASLLPYLKTKQLLWIYLATFKGAAGILFLDEMNQAKESIMSGLYQVVLDRKIGSKPISSGIMVGAAVNEGFSGTTPIIQGLMSRFRTGTLILDPMEWLRYSKEKGMDVRIIGFLEDNSNGATVADKLGQISPKGNPYLFSGDQREEDRSYPTPRTIWEFDREFYKRLKEFNLAKVGVFSYKNKLGDEVKNNNYTDIYNKFINKYGEDFLNDVKTRKAYTAECNERLQDRIKSSASGYCGRQWGSEFVKFLFDDLKFKIEDILRHAKSKTLVQQYKSASGNFNRIVAKVVQFLKKGQTIYNENNKTVTPELQNIFNGVSEIISNLGEGYDDVVAQFLSDLNQNFASDADFKVAWRKSLKDSDLDPKTKEEALKIISTVGQRYSAPTKPSV
jgi:hypothetical protein